MTSNRILFACFMFAPVLGCGTPPISSDEPLTSDLLPGKVATTMQESRIAVGPSPEGGGGGSLPSAPSLVRFKLPYRSQVVEQNGLGITTGDDWVRWNSGSQSQQKFCNPNVLYFQTDFAQPYTVLSDDLGDIQQFKYDVRAESPSTKIRIDIWLLDASGGKIPTTHSTFIDDPVRQSFGASSYNQDDSLGVLEGQCIRGFRVELTIESPPGACVYVGAITLEIEFWDIEAGCTP